MMSEFPHYLVWVSVALANCAACLAQSDTDKVSPPPPVTMSPRADVASPNVLVQTSGFCGGYQFSIENHNVRASNEFSSITARLDVIINYHEKNVTIPDDLLEGVGKVLAIAPYCNERDSLSMRIIGIDEAQKNLLVIFVGFRNGKYSRRDDMIFDGGQFIKEVQ